MGVSLSCICYLAVKSSRNTRRTILFIGLFLIVPSSFRRSSLGFFCVENNTTSLKPNGPGRTNHETPRPPTGPITENRTAADPSYAAVLSNHLLSHQLLLPMKSSLVSVCVPRLFQRLHTDRWMAGSGRGLASREASSETEPNLLDTEPTRPGG